MTGQALGQTLTSFNDYETFHLSICVFCGDWPSGGGGGLAGVSRA
ncbi:uncharacterized protein METZ01_LOCUS309567, partial [marine metagenome]